MRTQRHSKPWIGLLALVCLIGFVGDAVSQGQQRPGQRYRERSELEQMMQDQPQARFGATVSRVRVDVIVTDAEGDFVDDLTAADFEVFEDGGQQEIVNVQLVDLGAGRVRSLMDGATPAAPTPEPVETATTEAVSPGNAASGLGAIIFLIDAPSLDQAAKARFGDAWARMLEQTDALQVPRAAYMFNNYGRIEELTPLGNDAEAIRAAADTVREAPFLGNSMRRRMFEIADDLSNDYAFRTPDLARQLAAAKARGYEVQETNRSLATYELLKNFADALWNRPGRTAVVWVSTGIKLMQGGPYTALVAYDPRVASVPDGDPAPVDEGLAGARFAVSSPDARIKAAQDELHRAANAANVSFYTIDPTLLITTRQVGNDVEVGNEAAAGFMSSPIVAGSIDALRDSMRMAAAETGGKAFIQATDIAMVLEEIEQDTSRFYLVSYEPPNATGSGDYHEISVNVLREQINVRARGGYVDYPPENRARRSVEVALALPGLSSDLPVDAQGFRSHPPEEGPNLLTAVAVDSSELGLALDMDGQAEVSIDVHTVVLRNEEIVDEAHEQLSARSGASGLMAGGSDATLVGFLTYRREWTLEPGSYQVNVAVLDNVGGRVGGKSIDVEIPAETKAWGVSDPLLVTIDEAGRGQPAVLGRVLEGQSMAAFVEVFGGVQPVLSGQVFLARDEGGDPEQGARLFPTPMRPAGPGLHHGTLLLPSGMPPAGYFVELTIDDGAMREQRILRVPVQVISRNPGR